MKKEKKDQANVIALPNNVSLVSTSMGDILTHSPPEVLKSILSEELEIPRIILLPQDMAAGEELASTGFVRSGVNYASIEFVLYAQYFGKQNKCLIVVHTKSQKKRIRIILEETFEGPDTRLRQGGMKWLADEIDIVSLFPPINRAAYWPDLCEIVSLDETESGYIGEHTAIRVDPITQEYVFYEDEVEHARVSTRITEQAKPLSWPPAHPIQRQELTLQFIGGSDGFDPDGITTCFLAWFHTLDRTYVTLFDTAAFIRQRLAHLGLSTRHISEVVISHLHEDHIGGLPELILMGENQIQLITSDVIYKSLLRVLTAMFNLPTDEVASLFKFIPLNPGKPLIMGKRHFSAIYAVHSIPTLAIRFNDLYFSGDMRYDEAWFDELVEEGVIKDERRKELVSFADGADIIIQDAGGGTVHTTVTRELLEQMLEGGRQVILAHTKPDGLTDLVDALGNRIDFALSGRVVGLGEAISSLPEDPIMETILTSSLLARLSPEINLQLRQTINVVLYEAGEQIVQHGEPYNGLVYLVHKGLIEVWSEGTEELRLVAGRGSVIGERSALKHEEQAADSNSVPVQRMNNMFAQTRVELLQIDGGLFKHIADHLNLQEGFRKAEWLLQHSPFQEMLWADILDLALDLRVYPVAENDVLYQSQSAGYESFILVSGEIGLYNQNDELSYVLKKPGSFFGGRATLFSELHRFKAKAHSDGEVWVLKAIDLKRLHAVHPNISLQLRGEEMTTV